jgi:hypothetical protein
VHGLARLLAPLGGRPPWLLFVTDRFLFADESGTHAQAVGTLMAGYLCTEKEWMTIRKPWQRAHQKARLAKPFHMTDFVTPGHPDYAHLSDKEKKELIGTLAAGICCARRWGFIAAVLRQDYEAVFLPEIKKRLGDPYMYVFWLFMKTVISWATEHLPRGEKILCVFGEKKDMKTRAQDAYYELRTRHDPHGYLYDNCLFLPVRAQPHLVAADILANRAGHFFRRPGLRVAKHEDPVIYRLLTSRHLKYVWQFYDRAMLEEHQRDMITLGVVTPKPTEPSS